MFYKNISQIEIELTTRCNASCPQCTRNYYGGKTWPSLPLVDLDLNIMKSQITDDFLANMKEIRLCGTYGDPCTRTDLIKIVKWLKSASTAQIAIRTNGSLRNEKWWKDLAQVMDPSDIVYFGIDGLEDTNHLYRIGTNWQKIINNAKSFIENGGNAVWSYIVFEHNQHQVEQAELLSQQLGFNGFATKITSRFMDKQHKLVDKTPVMNKKERVIRWLKPATDNRYYNNGYDDYNLITKQYNGYNNYLKSVDINCMAQHTNLIYISAEGYVLPCGWLLDRLYGYEAESHPDRQKLINLIESNGGFDSINLKYNKIENIVNNSVFTAVEKSWSNEHRLERCAHQCGKESKSSMIATQNLKKFWAGTALG